VNTISAELRREQEYLDSALAALLPHGGLRRGITVTAQGSTSLLFALLARATETGSWAALVGMPNLGLRAAAELGVAVERLAVVRHPGADLPKVVAALLDGMDLVAVDPARLTDSQMHRLSARARHRGAVLIATGAWPGADLELTQEVASWDGLGDGHGHLTAREVHIHARGRRAARPTDAWLQLPARGGAVAELPAPEESRRLLPVHQNSSLPPGVPVRRFGASDGAFDTLPVSRVPSGAHPRQYA